MNTTEAEAKTKGAGKGKEGAADLGLMTRRRLVWAGVFGFLVSIALGTLKFFFPRSLFEPKTSFRVGFPADFALGVDTRFQQQYRVWVVRESSRLYVIYALCTHLGCTPDWNEAERKFKCPCHGSGYDMQGKNFEGPAPRPMARAFVDLLPDGQILCDTARRYEERDWEQSDGKKGAYITV